MESAVPGSGDLAAEIQAIDWYHTLELAPGLETPGWLDHRPVLDKIPLPRNLDGKRCLDVGTFNGFWAFEMERRGAEAVVGIDLTDPARWEWPAGSQEHVIEKIGERQARGRGFEIAKRALRSEVERLELSIYDLDPERVGRFDVVYVGSLLLHLRDPVRGLERVRSVCAGSLVVVDNIDPLLSLLLPRMPVARLDGDGRPWWWWSNPAALARMVEAAGLEVAEGPRTMLIPPGRGRPRARLHPRLLLSAPGRDALVNALRGDPHAALRAVPRAG